MDRVEQIGVLPAGTTSQSASRPASGACRPVLAEVAKSESSIRPEPSALCADNFALWAKLPYQPTGLFSGRSNPLKGKALATAAANPKAFPFRGRWREAPDEVVTPPVCRTQTAVNNPIRSRPHPSFDQIAGNLPEIHLPLNRACGAGEGEREACNPFLPVCSMIKQKRNADCLVEN